MWHNQHIWKTGQDTLRVETWLRINHWMVFPCLCHLLIKTILVIMFFSLNFCLLICTELEKVSNCMARYLQELSWTVVQYIQRKSKKQGFWGLMRSKHENSKYLIVICQIWMQRSKLLDNVLDFTTFLGVKLRHEDACLNVEMRNRNF